MRNLFESAQLLHGGTPPNGDFARYVEELVEQQSKALGEGQQAASQPPGKVAGRSSGKQPGQSGSSVLQTLQAAAAKAAKQSPVKTTALDSWTDSLLTSGAEKKKPPMPGAGFRIPPGLIYMAVILIIGASSLGNFRWVILLILFGLVFAAFKGMFQSRGASKGPK